MPRIRKYPNGGRRAHSNRQRHFMTIWFLDPETKIKICALAKNENRAANNYFNHHIAPVIDQITDAKLAVIPEDRKRRLFAEVEADWDQERERQSLSVLPPSAIEHSVAP
jgi:hypothetical protein